MNTKRQQPEARLRPIWWILFIAVQGLFILAGLAIFFWTLNQWDSDRRLDAIFGGGMGVFSFFFVWRAIRMWVGSNTPLWKPKVESGPDR